MTRYRCTVCPDADWLPGGLAALTEHYERSHGRLAGVPDVPNLNEWRSAAISHIEHFAVGHRFQMHEVFAVTGEPPNHKTANGGFTQEIESLNLAHIVAYGPSTRPGSKGSAVAIWQRGAKPKAEAA